MSVIRETRGFGLIAFAGMSLIAFNNCSGFEAGNFAGGSPVPANTRQIFLTQTSHPGSDLHALQQAIDRVKPGDSLLTEIVLEPRIYRLSCPAPEVQPLCVMINGRGKIRIKGHPGKTVLMLDQPRAGGFYVNDMDEFELSGVTLDYDTPPFLQGRIVAVHGADFEVRIDDGFVEFDHSLFAGDFYASSSPGSFVHHPGSRIIKGDASHWIGLSDVRPVRTLARKTWLVKSALPSVAAFMSVGDSYLIVPRPNTGSALHLSFNRRIKLQDVHIKTAPLFGLFLFGNQNSVDVERFRIEADGNRLISTAGDAIHAQNNRASLAVSNSRFAGMGDDGLNIYAYGSTVINSPGARQILVSGRNIPGFNDEFRDSDRLQALAPDRNDSRFVTLPKIIHAKREGADWRLTLDQEIPNALAAGDVVFNINLASPRSVVRKNSYGPFRGGVRLRGIESVFADNSFDDARNNLVLTTRAPDWPLEGPLQVGTETLPPEDPNPPVDYPAMDKSIFRFHSTATGAFFFRSSSAAGLGALEGVAFRLSSRAHSSLAPLYRCTLNDSSGEFLSRRADCEGQKMAERLGYISATRQNFAGQALVRCHRYPGGHLATRLAAECRAAGFSDEGVLGYVP